MLKIGQNWGKFANYPRNAQQRSVPLLAPFIHRTGTNQFALVTLVAH